MRAIVFMLILATAGMYFLKHDPSNHFAVGMLLIGAGYVYGRSVGYRKGRGQ